MDPMDMLNGIMDVSPEEALLEDMYETPTGEKTSNAALIADIINSMRADIHMLGQLHGVDISVDKMTPERAAELLGQALQGEPAELLETFERLENQRDSIIRTLAEPEPYEQFVKRKRDNVYSYDADKMEEMMREEGPPEEGIQQNDEVPGEELEEEPPAQDGPSEQELMEATQKIMSGEIQDLEGLADELDMPESEIEAMGEQMGLDALMEETNPEEPDVEGSQGGEDAPETDEDGLLLREALADLEYNDLRELASYFDSEKVDGSAERDVIIDQLEEQGEENVLELMRETGHV